MMATQPDRGLGSVAMVDVPRGYAALKAMAKRLKKCIPELLALAPKNDPFYTGSPAQREKAEWFAEAWSRFSYTVGVHLRRVHYQLVSQEDPRRHDGLPYENTDECWDYLCDAAKMARHLDLVSPCAFADHRNPDPHLLAAGAAEAEEPEYEAETPPEWRLPKIEADLTWNLDFSLPTPYVSGYDYTPADQPYHLEVWVEKSTQNDVLLPICRRLGANLVTSIGFQSITSAISLLQRAAETGKPVRVFYISDFDPSGERMPVAVARQLEYRVPDYAPGADIKLTPLALTREQVVEWRLPRIPIKESDLRKGAFEDRHGQGAVELDALEALHPGELARLAREALAPYRDPTLARRMEAAGWAAQDRVNEAWTEIVGSHRRGLADAETEAREIVERFTQHLSQLNAQLQDELAPLKVRLVSIRQDVENDAQGLMVDLPGRPEPETNPPDEAGWLFDARRTYGEQLAVYQTHKNGELVGGGDDE